MSDSGLIAWDTCILIDAIQQTENRWNAIAPMLNRAKLGIIQIVISTISLTECHYLRGEADKGVSQSDQNKMMARWFESSFLIKRPADFGVCNLAAELCQQGKGLKPMDAIIVATALKSNASALITIDGNARARLLANDMRFNTAAGKPLRICTPSAWTVDNSPQLFDTAT